MLRKQIVVNHELVSNLPLWMKQRNGYWKPEFFVAAAQTSKNELYFCSILYPWYWFDSCMHSAFSGKLRHWDGMIREKENNKYYLWSLEFTDLTISAIANPQVHRRCLICWQNSATVPSRWLQNKLHSVSKCINLTRFWLQAAGCLGAITIVSDFH
jgi:hypothetical protein